MCLCVNSGAGVHARLFLSGALIMSAVTVTETITETIRISSTGEPIARSDDDTSMLLVVLGIAFLVYLLAAVGALFGLI